MADTLFNIKLFLEGYEVDLSDSIDLATTYTIANVQDISKTTSNYTKSITLPGTKKNNQLFNWIYEIKSTGEQASLDADLPNIGYNYNFKRKARAVVLQDNMVVMQGYAKLQGATTKNCNTTYNIQITSELGALIADLGQIQLEDLDDIIPNLTSGYTHTFSVNNVLASWTATPCTQWFYPLVDYGAFETLNATNFYKDNLRPCLYAKQYLDL